MLLQEGGRTTAGKHDLAPECHRLSLILWPPIDGSPGQSVKQIVFKTGGSNYYINGAEERQ